MPGAQGAPIYVADSLNDRIQKFDADGNFLTTWGVYGTAGDGKFSRPGGVATDFAGNVYVVDAGNNRVQKFDSNGVFLSKLGAFGTANGQFNGPYGIVTDATGNVWVADSGNNRIQKFDSGGNFLLKVGGLGQGTGNSQFRSPADVGVDTTGNVYVTDAFNHRVKKHDPNGAFLAAWGSQGTNNGQFNIPYGIEVDSSIGVLVSDNNNRMQRFSTTGSFVSTTGSLDPATASSSSRPAWAPAPDGSMSRTRAMTGSSASRRPSAIVITKDAQPDDPQDFGFTAGGGLSPALCSSSTTTGTNSNELSRASRTFFVDPRLRLFGLRGSCPTRMGSQLGDVLGRLSAGANIDVSDGEVVTCTFTNHKSGPRSSSYRTPCRTTRRTSTSPPGGPPARRRSSSTTTVTTPMACPTPSTSTTCCPGRATPFRRRPPPVGASPR